MEERFIKKINKQSGLKPNGLETECWEWTAGTSGKYGWFNDGYAHRWSYIHFKGEIPEGKLIRHKCDNRKCVNPDHLEIGTKQENNKDARERNPKANGRKLQPTEYPLIVERMKTEQLKEIAKDYDMNWKSISKALDKAGLRPKFDYNKKVTEEMILQIKELREQGESYETIANQFGLSTSTVWKKIQ